uniref:Helicase C-terminal domain-containing protein n=1 Tax=Ditylenchus dipsaci TaxID=166011 RepID=A0A915CU90_9BILA
MIRSADHLAHYFHTMAVSDLLPNKYALEYLNNKMELYSHADGAPNTCSVDKKLLSIYMDATPSTPSLRDQLYILEKQYTEKPESRTLIFVSTRTCAQKLSEHLGQYLSKCRSLDLFCGKKFAVGFMTSSNQSASTGGQSADIQQDMVKRFAHGDLKILVVTSVAEEGINIAECNLIIKYNNVGSERTLIQRRGRARAKDSRAILLAMDSGVEQQEYENMRKEQMMMQCIRDLQAQTDDVLKKMIADKTEELLQANERKTGNRRNFTNDCR